MPRRAGVVSPSVPPGSRRRLVMARWRGEINASPACGGARLPVLDPPCLKAAVRRVQRRTWEAVHRDAAAQRASKPRPSSARLTAPSRSTSSASAARKASPTASLTTCSTAQSGLDRSLPIAKIRGPPTARWTSSSDTCPRSHAIIQPPPLGFCEGDGSPRCLAAGSRQPGFLSTDPVDEPVGKPAYHGFFALHCKMLIRMPKSKA